MGEYLLTPTTQADIEGIWDFTVSRWGVMQAERYVRDIQATCEALAAGTLISQPAEDIRSGYRKTLIGSHVLFFKQGDSAIEVMRILHQSMDIERYV